MTKIFSAPGTKNQPRIESSSVASFFSERAHKIANIGPTRAVIYQDKNPQLADRRDAAEKAIILPKLELKGNERVLDIGCGSGRWAEELIPRCHYYHGIDFSEGFIDYARQRFAGAPNCRFTVASATNFSLSSIDEPQLFDRLICIGVLMYLNDESMVHALRNMSQALAPGGIALLREPMGVNQRFTIQHHYSEDMDQVYSAIYRTQNEFEEAIKSAMFTPSFEITGFGNMYDDKTLNNRSETRQKWITVKRIS